MRYAGGRQKQATKKGCAHNGVYAMGWYNCMKTMFAPESSFTCDTQLYCDVAVGVESIFVLPRRSSAHQPTVKMFSPTLNLLSILWQYAAHVAAVLYR